MNLSPARPFGPVGIIDIGSNSVRFVAYGGSARVPSALFNEKIMPALGKGIAETGALDQAAVEATIGALGRFRLLAKEIGLKKLHTVATAAVRDASNGPDFLKRVTALGNVPLNRRPVNDFGCKIITIGRGKCFEIRVRRGP